MTKEIVYYRSPIRSPYKDQSAVTRVTFRLGNLDFSYFQKRNDSSRSHELGNIGYEFRGYQLLKKFGIEIPEFSLGLINGEPVLSTTQVLGTPPTEITNPQIFGGYVDLILSKHLDMWLRSGDSDTSQFEGVLKINPDEESLNTALRIEKMAETDGSLPEEFRYTLRKVIRNLLRNYSQANVRNRLFFQHGDEILNHFFVNKDGQITVIDPSPVLTNGMERALNKMLGASLLYNFEIGEDGKPIDGERVDTLIDTIRKYERIISEVNAGFGLPQTTCLSEITFINLARVYFGIYNPENAKYFKSMNTRKFLILSMRMYEELANRN